MTTNFVSNEVLCTLIVLPASKSPACNSINSNLVWCETLCKELFYLMLTAFTVMP
jgi:hypothetical protein